MISKYVDHLPLYRLELIADRDNVTLARSTLAEWAGRMDVALQPLVDRLSWHLLQGNMLQLMKLRLRNLNRVELKLEKLICGPTVNTPATLHFHPPWRSYRSNNLEPGPRISVFDYHPGAAARAFLGKWRSHLMIDDYGGYKALFYDYVEINIKKERIVYRIRSGRPTCSCYSDITGLNPAVWLKDTLEKLPAWPISRIDELLPFASDDIGAIKQHGYIQTTGYLLEVRL